MNDLEMTVTIKVNSNDFQSICELLKKIDDSNKRNEDELVMNLSQKMFMSRILYRLKDSGKRKANKLEAISSEFINSLR